MAQVQEATKVLTKRLGFSKSQVGRNKICPSKVLSNDFSRDACAKRCGIINEKKREEFDKGVEKVEQFIRYELYSLKHQMVERTDKSSSRGIEFQMGSIPQGSALAKIVKWQILKTGKKGAYQIIREDHTDVAPNKNMKVVLMRDLKTNVDPPIYRGCCFDLTTHPSKVKYPLPSRVCQAMHEKKFIGDRKDECFGIWIGEMKLRIITLGGGALH
ncbi:hypothetical protein Tco_1123924 [Tanacetum coccineum]|uniref:Reverse transcriptase n=1 Tax=Tanacetum coccineum TaxID=301880 RepID=A0ABQ5J4R8_9ASTR